MYPQHRYRKRQRLPHVREARAAAPETQNADPMAQLAFIRSTMEGAAVFTSVPGRGQMVIGATAMVAAYIAAQGSLLQNATQWLSIWMFEALLAGALGFYFMHRKAKQAGQSLFYGVGKRVVMNLVPPLFVGGLLTILLHHFDLNSPIPAMWLMLYGTAVISAGAFSVGIVPVMGVCFLALGTVTAFTPVAWVDWTMALGFGGLHLL